MMDRLNRVHADIALDIAAREFGESVVYAATVSPETTTSHPASKANLQNEVDPIGQCILKCGYDQGGTAAKSVGVE